MRGSVVPSFRAPPPAAKSGSRPPSGASKSLEFASANSGQYRFPVRPTNTGGASTNAAAAASAAAPRQAWVGGNHTNGGVLEQGHTSLLAGLCTSGPAELKVMARRQHQAARATTIAARRAPQHRPAPAAPPHVVGKAVLQVGGVMVGHRPAPDAPEQTLRERGFRASPTRSAARRPLAYLRDARGGLEQPFMPLSTSAESGQQLSVSPSLISRAVEAGVREEAAAQLAEEKAGLEAKLESMRAARREPYGRDDRHGGSPALLSVPGSQLQREPESSAEGRRVAVPPAGLTWASFATGGAAGLAAKAHRPAPPAPDLGTGLEVRALEPKTRAAAAVAAQAAAAARLEMAGAAADSPAPAAAVSVTGAGPQSFPRQHVRRAPPPPTEPKIRVGLGPSTTGGGEWHGVTGSRAQFDQGCGSSLPDARGERKSREATYQYRLAPESDELRDSGAEAPAALAPNPAFDLGVRPPGKAKGAVAAAVASADDGGALLPTAAAEPAGPINGGELPAPESPGGEPVFSSAAAEATMGAPAEGTELDPALLVPVPRAHRPAPKPPRKSPDKQPARPLPPWR